MASRSDFEIVKVTDEFVFIRDLNIGNRSVTNDAENVVVDVNRMHNGKRIIYQDSEGSWNELLHSDGRFEGFSPYRGTIPD